MSFNLKIVNESTQDSFMISVENSTTFEFLKLKISDSRNLNYNDIVLLLNGQPV
jgi:hypothetical protein